MYLKDPITNPFSDWLKANGVYVAIAVAAVLVVIVLVIFLLSWSKKR